MVIHVCVGSGCHLKGSYDIIHLFKEAINQYQLQDQVELKASFCLGNCMAGVSVKVNENILSHVTTSNFTHFFETHVLKALEV